MFIADKPVVQASYCIIHNAGMNAESSVGYCKQLLHANRYDSHYGGMAGSLSGSVQQASLIYYYSKSMYCLFQDIILDLANLRLNSESLSISNVACRNVHLVLMYNFFFQRLFCL